MFDEDPKVVYSSKSSLLSGIEAKISSDISSIFNFAKMWLLELCLEKYFNLQIDFIFSRNIGLDGHRLLSTSVVRDVGLPSSSSLNYAENAAQTVFFASSHTGLILCNLRIDEI